MSFQDKVVIVTGGSSGIEAATAIKFAEEGAKVTIVGRNKAKVAIVVDLTKNTNVKRIVSETLSKFGKLDILINNAGMARTVNNQSETAMAEYDEVISTNLRPLVYLTHLSAPHLAKTKGNIVIISSIAAFKTLAQINFSYSTSKAGLDHFSRAVAQELPSSGVRVNIVNPGPVRTDFVENMGINVERIEAFEQVAMGFTALRRISDPEVIADLVLFLASDKAKAITGSSFVSDNGALLK